jgi:hypothetical protein
VDDVEIADLETIPLDEVDEERPRRDFHPRRIAWLAVALVAIGTTTAAWFGTRAGGDSPSHKEVALPTVVYPRADARRFFTSSSFLDDVHGYGVVEVDDSKDVMWTPTEGNAWFMTTSDGGASWSYVGRRVRTRSMSRLLIRNTE